MSYRPDVRPAPIEAIADLWRKWDSKNKLDGEVLGALELAYLRGYQGGFQDSRDGKKAQHYVERRKPRIRRKPKPPNYDTF